MGVRITALVKPPATFVERVDQFFQDVVTPGSCGAENVDSTVRQSTFGALELSISLIVRLEQELASRDSAPACVVGVNVGYSLTVIMHTKFQTARLR
jgi:hypothetical protein